MEEALQLLKDKQVTAERWKLENTFNGKMLVDIEKRVSPQNGSP